LASNQASRSNCFTGSPASLAEYRSNVQKAQRGPGEPKRLSTSGGDFHGWRPASRLNCDGRINVPRSTCVRKPSASPPTRSPRGRAWPAPPAVCGFADGSRSMPRCEGCLRSFCRCEPEHVQIEQVTVHPIARAPWRRHESIGNGIGECRAGPFFDLRPVDVGEIVHGLPARNDFRLATAGTLGYVPSAERPIAKRKPWAGNAKTALSAVFYGRQQSSIRECWPE